jgi:hypothetical protein
MLSNVVVALTLLLAQARSGIEVPSSLLTAAGTDPTTFIKILTQVGIPAGLEIRQSKYIQHGRTPSQWNYEQWTAERLAQQRLVPIEQLVAAFNQHHPDYQAAMLDGVLVIRPTDRPLAYLDGRGPTGQLRAVGLMNLADKVFVPIDSSLDVPGRIVSELTPAGIDVDFGHGVELVIDASARLVIDVLNEVVRQARGHSWLVVTTDDPVPAVTQFGFLHRHGTGSVQTIRR